MTCADCAHTNVCRLRSELALASITISWGIPSEVLLPKVEEALASCCPHFLEDDKTLVEAGE